MSHRTRRRRGHPKGKALGFRGLHPATKTKSSTDGGGSNASTPSAPSQSAPSSPSSGS